MNKRSILFIIVFMIMVCSVLVLNRLADFLVIKDQGLAKHADVIIVLGGESKGERTEKAVELYKKGIANKLLFTDGTGRYGQRKNIDNMVDLARKLGVPKNAIWKETKAHSTYQNAEFTKKILLDNHWKSAVVVTTIWHTKRSKFAFDMVYSDSSIRLSYAAAEDKQFQTVNSWWLDGQERKIVVKEWAKLIYYSVRYGVMENVYKLA